MAHHFVLIYVAGVYAFAAHPEETFPEIAVPAFTAHFAVGHNPEAGFDFAVNQAVNHPVFLLVVGFAAEVAAHHLAKCVFKFFGREETAHNLNSGHYN